MFWADQIADAIEKRFAKQIKDGVVLRIRDEKTLSGRVHVGSLRGVVLHGIISEVLTERGIKNEYLFELNDFDPMDGLPTYLDEAVFKQHMGKPLHTVPWTDTSANSYADHWGKEFVNVIHSIGFNPTFYYIRDVYTSGAFNETIRLSLEHADEIRRVYKEVSGSVKPDDWLPLQVICENCGKVGTTKVISFDGNNVAYRCEPKLVAWAVGCGHAGIIEPWNGNAKLPFKVEWAAKFAYLPRPIGAAVPYGVDIEGAGKDHATKGGTRDIAAHICEEIFKHPAPFDIPYNFFEIGGRKMSSSSGKGSSAFEIAQLLPPELLRFLVIRKQPKHQIDFNPEGNTIPLLYDEYDRVADQYFDKTVDRTHDPVRFYHFAQLPEHRSTTHYSLLTTHPSTRLGLPRLAPVFAITLRTGRQGRLESFRPRFSLVSFIIQMPHLDPMKEIETLKGSKLTKEDSAEAKSRITYAKQWLDKYVLDDFKFVLQEKLPDSAMQLTDTQRFALKQLYEFLVSNPNASGEEIHAYLHSIKEVDVLEPWEVFEPVYIIFLNRRSGPQAGWFLHSLQRGFVLLRLKEAIT